MLYIMHLFNLRGHGWYAGSGVITNQFDKALTIKIKIMILGKAGEDIKVKDQSVGKKKSE